ncbi:MAG: hypothetical protein ACRDFW_07665 [bacterium]
MPYLGAPFVEEGSVDGLLAERGEALVDYLGVSDMQLASAAERMVANGKHELAAAVLRWAQPRFANSARLDAVRKLAYLRLMEKYQEFNPFKFILYSGEIEEFTTQINAPLVGTTSMPAPPGAHAMPAPPNAGHRHHPWPSRSARDGVQSLRRAARALAGSGDPNGTGTTCSSSGQPALRRGSENLIRRACGYSRSPLAETGPLPYTMT